MPLYHPKENQKEKENKINIKSEKLDKRKEKKNCQCSKCSITHDLVALEK